MPASEPQTERPADELFSHPETHDSHAKPSSADEQRSYADLFREPAPRASA